MSDFHMMAWTEIESSIQAALMLPYGHRDPWGVDPVNPGNGAARLFRSMLALCDLHTGLRPLRIDASADGTFVAEYGDGRSGYPNGVIEVYPEDDEGLPTVIGWSAHGDVHTESLTVDQAADGCRFKTMARHLKGVRCI